MPDVARPSNSHSIFENLCVARCRPDYGLRTSLAKEVLPWLVRFLIHNQAIPSVSLWLVWGPSVVFCTCQYPPGVSWSSLSQSLLSITTVAFPLSAGAITMVSASVKVFMAFCSFGWRFVGGGLALDRCPAIFVLACCARVELTEVCPGGLAHQVWRNPTQWTGMEAHYQQCAIH